MSQPSLTFQEKVEEYASCVRHVPPDRWEDTKLFLTEARRVLMDKAQRPECKLNMSLFVAPFYLNEDDAWSQEEEKCGTIACVAGWMALDPWFNNQGFTLNKDFATVEMRKSSLWYGNSSGMNAIGDLFGLRGIEFSMSGLYNLFSPEHGPEDEGFGPAIERINAYLAAMAQVEKEGDVVCGF